MHTRHSNSERSGERKNRFKSILICVVRHTPCMFVCLLFCSTLELIKRVAYSRLVIKAFEIIHLAIAIGQKFHYFLFAVQLLPLLRLWIGTINRHVNNNTLTQRESKTIGCGNGSMNLTCQSARLIIFVTRGFRHWWNLRVFAMKTDVNRRLVFSKLMFLSNIQEIVG
jgi:hypothetical protein